MREGSRRPGNRSSPDKASRNTEVANSFLKKMDTTLTFSAASIPHAYSQRLLLETALKIMFCCLNLEKCRCSSKPGAVWSGRVVKYINDRVFVLFCQAKNNSLYLTMTRPVFIFLGVLQPGATTDINALQAKLASAITADAQRVKLELKKELLVLTLTNPVFSFYITLVNNDRRTVNEWKECAKDFNLPWDIKPVNKSRLENIYAHLGSKGIQGYAPHQKLGFVILEEMEKIEDLKVFTIPSM